MPNRCENTLTIHAKDREQGEQILKDLCFKKGEDPLFDSFSDHNPRDADGFYPSFHKLLPYKNKLGEYGDPQIENYTYWGTKWDMFNQSLYAEDGYISLTFDTAWSPPQQWLDTLISKYPGACIELHSEEPGANFEIHQGVDADGERFYQESEYRQYCEGCDTRDGVVWDNEQEAWLCKDCAKE